VARDRSRQHTKVRRAATRGEIVICDRYPIPDIKLMDGPRLARFETSPHRSERLLARLERRYYDRILPPDVLLVLRVDPHKAATRKVEEDSDFVRIRANEVWELDWTRSAATVIDASQPLEDVVRKAKDVLWSRL
jgi:thymidylate kinase